MFILPGFYPLSCTNYFICDSPCGGEKTGRVNDGFVYDSPYGGKAIGRTEKKDGSGYWLREERNE